MLDIVKKINNNKLYKFFFLKILKLNINKFKIPRIITFNFQNELIKKSVLYKYKDLYPSTKYVDLDDPYQSNHDLINNKDFKNLLISIENYLNNYLKLKLLNIKFGQFKIKNLWFVIMSKNQNIKVHSHPKAVFSGVYYLTPSKTNGGLVILQPKNNKDIYEKSNITIYDNIIIHGKNISEENKNFKFSPDKNDLIIFNSYLYHYVEKYNDNSDRLCVAWDAIYTL